MTNHTYLFTSESVSEGHPDKVADRTTNRILDAFLARDPTQRVACETLLADQYVVVAGEFKRATRPSSATSRQRPKASCARRSPTSVTPTPQPASIRATGCEIRIAFNHPVERIGQGVERADGELGAGDQGLMFGYA